MTIDLQTKDTLLMLFSTVRSRGGSGEVWLSFCCGRVYVGVGKPTACRTCEKTPEAVRVESEGDVVRWYESRLKNPPT